MFFQWAEKQKADRLTLVSHCCSFSFLSLASALCFSSNRCLASVAASMSFSFRFSVTSLHNLMDTWTHRLFLNEAFCICIFCKAAKVNSQFHFSPSRLVFKLVFQLSHFLLNDAHPLSVYEHCVLLETDKTIHICSYFNVFIYCKSLSFSSDFPPERKSAFTFWSINKWWLVCPWVIVVQSDAYPPPRWRTKSN